ncbi:MAG TPA: UDP-glucose 6-dehydrogenase, partial [Candidatus Limnocylindria bacterium]|nr:UDP-glucose 6-dehydrogenase [Candidatus Limnocylindria bacterium]
MKIKPAKKKAAVIGLWHLGCTVAAALAKSGFDVVGFDFDQKLIANLNKAIMPIAEPGLSELTQAMLKSGRLSFTSDFKKLSAHSYIIIGYDTP